MACSETVCVVTVWHVFQEMEYSNIIILLKCQYSKVIKTHLTVYDSAKWAWLRLGLNQQRVGDHTAAITSLQSALRADSKDR